MEKKQSSIDWLALYIKGISSLNSDEIIEKAKAMHKEEIKDAVDSCGYQDESEYYYNETFGGES